MSSERCPFFFSVRFDDSNVEEYRCNGDSRDTTTLSDDDDDDDCNLENSCTIRLPWRLILLLLSLPLSGIALNEIVFSINTMVSVSFTGILLYSLYPSFLYRYRLRILL